MQHDLSVDARGLACPLPLLKARLALNGLQAGQVLQVLATDAGSQRDLASFCQLAGHALLHQEQTAEGVFLYLIRKQDAAQAGA
ncbi:MAG: sulfurtransferase TusA family protein [Thiopseudomonas sp.]|nr:sulfurtransferase TusA family protein [Thiopseudomonas sp.]